MTRHAKPPCQTLRVIGALIIRETITRYGRTWGGYAWAVLEPVAGIVLLTLLFTQVLRTPPMGSSFALFYATGILPFHVFTDLATIVAGGLGANRELLRLPMVRPLDIALARGLLAILTHAVVATLILGGLAIILVDPIRIDFAPLLIAFAGAILLGFGLGLVNAVLFTFSPEWRELWSVLRRPLMIISGIFFLFGSLPERLQDWLWWNPVIHIVGRARSAFYPAYRDEYVSMTYVFALGTLFCVLGMALLARHRGRIVEERF